MTASLKTYLQILTVKAGVEMKQFGETGIPITEISYDGTFQSGPQKITLAAGEVRELWAYTDTADDRFSIFAVRVISDGGFVWVSKLVDLPTNLTTNFAPTGTRPMWFHEGLSCNAAVIYTSDLVLHHATAANVYAANGTLPALVSDGAKATGKIYRITVYNPDDESVELEYAWAGEP
jgi:hypothetical protein